MEVITIFKYIYSSNVQLTFLFNKPTRITANRTATVIDQYL